jgi:hypothetical protein
MIATFEDAHLLFARWQEQSRPLRVKLLSNRLVFEATGTVGEHTTAALQLNGPAWQFTVPIEGAEYQFSDPREIPIPTVRDIETAKYEFGLAIGLPSGDRLVLLEIKNSESSSTSPDDAEPV